MVSPAMNSLVFHYVPCRNIRIREINGLPDEQAVRLIDEEKLHAILTNLIKNALKFTQKGWVEFGYHVEKGSRFAVRFPITLEDVMH